MKERNLKSCCICLLIFIQVKKTASVLWEQVRCSTDAVQNVPEGSVADIGRFPWLGIVQHSFYIGGRTHFAITPGVLIHPGYAIAPAQDISKILRDQLRNNTKFIVWHNNVTKYALDVSDYILHPEYEDQRILATIALLELVTGGETGIGENPYPVLPICLPISGGGSFTDMYAVKFTDESGELRKEAFKMSFVNDNDCKAFYEKNQLTYSKMSPVSAYCAKVERPTAPCVWDGGVALVSRQAWGFWKFLGFSVRGPGCGAPTRFLVMHDYLSWINDMLSQLDPEEEEDVLQLGVRRLSPIKIIMYNAMKRVPKEQGQCHRKSRGLVLYKDSFEVTMNKDFGQGFFYVVVSQIALFNCAVVHLEDFTARTNAAVWLEHYCHRELTGIAHKMKKPDYTKGECFLYFKSAAFIKFRFYYSFKALVEVTLFGTDDIPRRIPNPFQTDETTDSWWPTDKTIEWTTFDGYMTLGEKMLRPFVTYSRWQPL